MSQSLWADFNQVDGDMVWTSTCRSRGAVFTPEPGDHVVLYDDDAASCGAIVTEVSGPIVTCRLDWSQWHDPQPEWVSRNIVQPQIATVTGWRVIPPGVGQS